MRTELQLSFAWCMTGLTRGEYDSEERKKIEERKGVLNDEYEKTDNPRRSSSSVREAKRRSLFHSIHDRTNISASLEHLCQDPKRR